MAYFLSPIGNTQQLNANGAPLNAGKIYTYLAGSTTPVASYTSSLGTTPQANPIILNSLGLPASPIWLNGGVAVKFVIQDSAGVTVQTIDNVSGINDTTTTPTEWVSSGFVPTYINATSFSVPGDQTGVLHVERRLKTSVTAGIAYSTITVVSFSAGITTVTVANDSTALDSGLSAVMYGLIDSTNRSIPTVIAATSTDNSTKVATTAWAKFGFSTSLGSSGYLAFPTWLGGLIVQWGFTTIAAAGVAQSDPFLLTWPTGCYRMVGSMGNTSNAVTSAVNIGPLSTTQYRTVCATTDVVSWIAVGK